MTDEIKLDVLFFDLFHGTAVISPSGYDVVYSGSVDSLG